MKNLDFPDDLIPEQLIGQLQQQRWYAHQQQADPTVYCLDWLKLESDYYWLLLGLKGGARYSLLLSLQGRKCQLQNDFCQLYNYLYSQCDKRVITQAGAELVLRANKEFPQLSSCTPMPLDSSNLLQQGYWFDTEIVVKSYSQLYPGLEREHECFSLLGGSGRTPELFALLEYRPREANAIPLTIVTSKLMGEALYLPLSRQLRALMQQGTDTEDFEQLPQAMAELCQATGSAIAGFHQANAQAHSTTHYDFAGFCQRSQLVVQELMNALADSELVDERFRQDGLSALALCNQSLFSQGSQVFPGSGFVHGDLHLSHIYFCEMQQECQLLDPAPLQEGKSGHSLMDLASLQRSLEYFSLDELSAHIAKGMGGEQSDVVHRWLSGHLKSGLWDKVTSWRQAILADIHRSYCGAQSHASEFDKAYLAFYFRRLLDEMSYNIQYQRPFYLLCDLFYLKQLTGDIQCMS